MQHAERGGLAKNAQPVGGCEFFGARGQFQRIRAVHAVQRTAVRDLGNQGQRVRRHRASTHRALSSPAFVITGICHPERSEGPAICDEQQVLCFAQDDNSQKLADEQN
jgi:hypothetical protein